MPALFCLMAVAARVRREGDLFHQEHYVTITSVIVLATIPNMMIN